ncbi:MAG: SIS domain-containing protein [Deltaproteobacteria bacterium]|nr:SIS domain-containing protein [Deltaproteobacteria bacterium]
MGIKSLLRKIGITGLYFCRSLRNVPEGSVVVFPYDETVISCGITGILAFKRPFPAANHSGDVRQLEQMVESLSECFLGKPDKKALGGGGNETDEKDLLRKTRRLCEGFKTHALFYELFSNRAYQEKLAALCTRLEGIIKNAQQTLEGEKGRLAADKFDEIALRITELRDIVWLLKHEVVANIEKVTDLGCFGRHDAPPAAVGLLKEINLIFNNLDRLEVRGRDSAGISVLCVVDQSIFSQFRQRLQDESLLDEFKARTAHKVLANRCIRINEKGPSGISVAFTYKIAAEVGGLGDNVQYLRNQVLGDSIFLHLLRFPLIQHSVLAHTRWASVGEISEPNCHPVDNDSLDSGIIHVCLNGDIDNYRALRRNFERETGRSIAPEITTDTKIIPLRIEQHLLKTNSIEEAFRLAVSEFEGSHAIAMHSDLAPGKVFLAQKGSGQAIFVGLAKDYYVPASETYGFVEQTQRYVKMDGEKKEDGLSGKTQGQIFILDSNSEGGLGGIRAMYYDGTPIELSEKDVKETGITSRDIDRQGYPHYFLKEISESPRSVEQTIQGRLSILKENGNRRPQILLDNTVIPDRLESAFRENRIRKIFFIGQGTAGIAASGCTTLLRDYLNHTNIRVASFKASEFSGFMLDDTLDDTLVIAITQSGTTTDTNRAIDMARGLRAYTMAIVNRRDSDITFKVDGVLYTSTGRDIEMSVASTKAYYCQIVAGSILGLRIAQLTESRTDDFLMAEIAQLWELSSCMNKVLQGQSKIRQSAERFSVTKTYWAIVGSGPNKVAADEIRIKLSELCYKSISSDVVEDKKHIDLSSEPLILVCAAGSRDSVVTDIVKDTAIFKAHEAVPIVIATEGEDRFEPYADSVIYVPKIKEHFAPILNTLAGHLWGYYAALTINKESQYLFNFREEISNHIDTSTDNGLDVYEIVLDKAFREKTAGFYRAFKERIRLNRYATAMAIHTASDLMLLLKYLAGSLPIRDFEFDFGVKGTAPNMLRSFFACIGKIINEMTRPIDAIKHQAKTVTVGTSRISEKVEGLLFEALENRGFNKHQLTTSNILVLKRLQEVVAEIKGVTIYKIAGLSILGEPTEESTIYLASKEGSSAGMISRIESNNRLHGTKHIIVKNGNVFIGKGKRDNRSILIAPVISVGTKIDHLVLFDIEFQRQLELGKKVDALGGKYHHIRNLIEETSLPWEDGHLNLLEIEELFGMSAEKISEHIVSKLRT